MKKLFIKVQTSVGQSWADSIESINSYVDDRSDDVVKTALSQGTYNQIANIYTQISNKVKLFKNPFKPGYAIAVAVARGDAGFKEVDLNVAFDCLKPSNGSYESVHFGYVFPSGEKSAKDFEVIENSFFFARDLDTKRFVNAETGEELTDEDKIEVATWFTIYKIKGTDLYYMVINPNLLAVPEDLSGTIEDVECYQFNTRDGTLRTKLFRPSVKGGSFIGDNIIVANEDQVIIDTFGLSLLHYIGTKTVDPSNLPAKINLDIKSSLPITRDGTKITIDVSEKSVGTLSYQWVTETYLDHSLAGNESLKYSFAIIKE